VAFGETDHEEADGPRNTSPRLSVPLCGVALNGQIFACSTRAPKATPDPLQRPYSPIFVRLHFMMSPESHVSSSPGPETLDLIQLCWEGKAFAVKGLLSTVERDPGIGLIP